MAEDSSSGLSTAVQLALSAEAVPAPEVEDEEPVLDLLGLPSLEAMPKRANLARAGKGRPPGVRNHSTQYWLEYITRKYGSPLEILAQMSRAPIADLARELGCSKLDAFGEKRKAAEALAPYLHAKLSSVTVYPAGDPRGGIASELILESKDFGVIDSGMIVEPTPAADDQVPSRRASRPCRCASRNPPPRPTPRARSTRLVTRRLLRRSTPC